MRSTTVSRFAVEVSRIALAMFVLFRESSFILPASLDAVMESSDSIWSGYEYGQRDQARYGELKSWTRRHLHFIGHPLYFIGMISSD